MRLPTGEKLHVVLRNVRDYEEAVQRLVDQALVFAVAKRRHMGAGGPLSAQLAEDTRTLHMRALDVASALARL